MELGGVKLGINEQMVINLLYHFYPTINQEIRYIPGEDIHFEQQMSKKYHR